MSEIALSAAVSSSLKPADFGHSEPPSADGYAAVAAGIGFASVQTSARQHGAPAASLGRIEGAPGNVLPLRALNGAASRLLAAPQAGTAAGTGAQRDERAGVPWSMRRVAPDRFMPAMEMSANALPAGSVPAFDPWLPPRGADGLPVALMPVASERGDPALLTGAGQMAALTADPLAAGHTPATAGGASPAAVVSTDSALPLHHPRFAEAFSQQVVVMARDGIQHARITVNPPELGPLEMRITIRNDEATVHFAAQHVAVRDALEQAMPRLREQFEQAGLQLHDGAVFEQLPQRSPGQGYEAADRALALPFDDIDDGTFAADDSTLVRHGLIDAYA